MTVPEMAVPEAPVPEATAPEATVPEAPFVDGEGEVIEITGDAPLRTESRSASDFTVARDVLEAAPRAEGADVLRTAPGIYIGRGEGAAVAHRYMLRGFDADHGQDLELRAGGLPINLPSHIHGQGYADLGFLIGETVHALHVREGVYDPRQGDFAVAGSIDVELGVVRRGVRVKSGLGRFGTSRHLLVWAPPGADRETFGAVQYHTTDGYGTNRRGQGVSAIAQTAFQTTRWRHRAIGFLYGARSDLAGVLREDDVRAGRVDFYETYPFPTAQAQNALAGRVMLGLFSTYRGPAGDNAELGAWLGFDDFRLQENFTGFVQRSRTLEDVAGRGDLIEQQNRTSSLGLSGRYSSDRRAPSPHAAGRFELGFAGRFDIIEQQQNLLDAAVRNQTWDNRVDAGVRSADIGFWADLDWTFYQRVSARAGVRADGLLYDVDDRLGNFVPIIRPDDSFIPGFRRSAFGLAWGPRASLDASVLPWLSLRAAYGEGYRSPQARTLEDGERAPFAKVRSADLGARITHERLTLAAAGYFTRLSDDVAFEAREGRLERIGATQRLGAVVQLDARPLDWLVGAVSVTYVDAELLAPPPPSAEEPQPPFAPGQNLPFIPPVVVRADVGVAGTVGQLGSRPVTGRAGVGFTFLSSRPLPFGDFADPVALLDSSASLRWGSLELGLELFNSLGSRYSAVEFSFASDWNPDAPSPRVPARHFAAGAPLAWLVTLEASL